MVGAVTESIWTGTWLVRSKVGAQALSNYASEFIVAVGTFIETGLTLDEIKEIVFPHPTVSEIVREAVFQYNG